MPTYPILESEIAKRGYKKKVIASVTNIAETTFRCKMRGKTDFTWKEACRIQENFFPDINKDTLFTTTPNKNYTNPQ